MKEEEEVRMRRREIDGGRALIERARAGSKKRRFGGIQPGRSAHHFIQTRGILILETSNVFDPAASSFFFFSLYFFSLSGCFISAGGELPI